MTIKYPKLMIEELEKEKNPNITRYQKNKLIRRMFKKYPYLTEKYFLDICGVGEILEFLDSLKMRGEGIDLSENACFIAMKRVSNNIKVRNIDFMKINEKYELIIMFDILEHVKDDDSFVKKSYNFLKENGYYLINVPAKKNLYGKKDKYFGHYRRYDKEEIIKLLKNNGFKILEFWSYGFKFTARVYEYLFNEEVKGDESENTIQSSIKTPKSISSVNRWIKHFYWIINCFQKLLLNTDIGSEYMILCRK